MNAFDRMRHTARTRKLCKDTVNGWIFGICAGIAWWLGVKVWFIRVLAVIALCLWTGPVILAYAVAALCLWTGPVILAYAVAALVLNRRPRSSYDGIDERYGRRWGADRGGRDWRREWDRFERGSY